jgi:hypothetical protein
MGIFQKAGKLFGGHRKASSDGGSVPDTHETNQAKENDNNTKTVMTLYPKLITDAMRQVIYPGTKKNLVDSEMIADNIRIDGMTVSFSIIFPRNTDPFIKSTL